MVAQGTISAGEVDLITLTDSPAEVVERILASAEELEPPAPPRRSWLLGERKAPGAPR